MVAATEVEVLGALERMASYGTAPDAGCSVFSVGYGDAFDRIARTYLERQFNRGRSADKFVVGPFGVGKTHFARQLCEVAQDQNCVTIEVQLNKDVDFTKTQAVYREVAREIRSPLGRSRGMRSFLRDCLSNVMAHAPGDGLIKEQVVAGWIRGLKSHDFELEAFGRVVSKALEAMQADDETTTDACVEWLSGEFTDRRVADAVGRSVVPAADVNSYASRMLLSLFQFVRVARFQGTVLVFDETEQGLNVSNKKTEVILSMLQSRINATADLLDGSVLTVYALTADLMEKMSRLAALQQRVTDPSPDQTFFKGHTLAPIINLEELQAGQSELERMGLKYLEVASRLPDWDPTIDLTAEAALIKTFGREIALEDASSESRRTMAKRTCRHLLNRIEGFERSFEEAQPVEDEV